MPVNGYTGENQREKFAEFSFCKATVWLELRLTFLQPKWHIPWKLMSGKCQKSYIWRKIVKKSSVMQVIRNVSHKKGLRGVKMTVMSYNLN